MTDENKEIAIVHYDEIIRGKKLGHGSFSDVYLMEEFRSLPEHDNTFDAPVREARSKLNSLDEGTVEVRDSSNTFSSAEGYGCNIEVAFGNIDLTGDPSQNSKYAIKSIKQDFEDPKMFRFAAKDLDTEIQILQRLDHPHIIKLFAKSVDSENPKDCTRENAQLYFMLVDRLSATLTDRISQWKRDEQRLVGKPFAGLNPSSPTNTKNEFLMERLRVAHDVASALSFLHSQNFIYRDLKADNVGFDFSGKCKLFDFGLSRELPGDGKEHKANDRFQMSGKTGSLLLMAPEVFHRQPYNQKADVYSFAILLWSIFALELPYLDFIRDHSFETKVMDKGKRPNIQGKWPNKIQFLLRMAWNQNIQMRPTMEEVRKMIKEAIGFNQKDRNQNSPKFRLRSSFL